MEQVTTGVTQFLLTQGWAGIVVLLSGIVIWDQRRDIQYLRDRNVELQNLRVQDTKEMLQKCTVAIETTRSAVQSFTEVLRDRKV